jgi:hypothetical protein
MKTNRHFFSLVLLLLASCTGVKTTVHQIENEGFLEFVGSKSSYSENLKVFIDDHPGFDAQVNKEYSDRPKGIKYAIPTGLHKIKITLHGKEIFSDKFFISSQETQKIKLP